MDLYRYTAEAKRIKVEADFRHSALADTIQVDKVKMTGAIQNLIENTIKYSTEDTQVTVSTFDHDGWLHISVLDQGDGIPPEELPLIFQRHWRGRLSKESAVDGTGIGLSIAKYIVNARGQYLSAMRVGQGERVYHQASAAISSFTRAWRRRMARILVVDDKLAHRRFIADVLKSEGHVVEVAENGQQALDMLDQRSFDLVTLDQQMSKMTGLECYEILRTRDRRIRVVFITVFGGEPEFARLGRRRRTYIGQAVEL